MKHIKKFEILEGRRAQGFGNKTTKTGTEKFDWFDKKEYQRLIENKPDINFTGVEAEYNKIKYQLSKIANDEFFNKLSEYKKLISDLRDLEYLWDFSVSFVVSTERNGSKSIYAKSTITWKGESHQIGVHVGMVDEPHLLSSYKRREGSQRFKDINDPKALEVAKAKISQKIYNDFFLKK